MPRYEPMGYYFDTGRILHTSGMVCHVAHVHFVDMLFSTRVVCDNNVWAIFIIGLLLAIFRRAGLVGQLTMRVQP